MAVTVCGYSGSVLYITDVRCLRDMQELLDDIDAKLEVEVGKVAASVKEVYTKLFSTITAGTAVFLILRTLSKTGTDQIQPTSRKFRMDRRTGRCWIEETQTSSYYLRQIVKVPKAGPFTVRFKAECGEGQTSRIRMTAGTNKYTDAESVTKRIKLLSWSSIM
ncbi:MAG: hypothetical protein ACLU00_08405 [Mediterraneibacter faecis]